MKVRIELKFNPEGIRSILTAPEVFGDVKARADRIAAACNAGISDLDEGEADPYLATELVLEEPRAAASVITRTTRGKRDNLRNGTLLSNLDKGR